MTQAWQARDSALQQRLEGIINRIIVIEDAQYTHTLRMFLFLTEKALTQGSGGKGGIGFNMYDLSDISYSERYIIFELFALVLADIDEFQKALEERLAILAKLLVWLAERLAHPHLAEYQRIQPALLQRVYGVENSTDDVPAR